MEKGAFRRIAAPFIRDTARRATLPRPRETMRPSIYRMKTRPAERRGRKCASPCSEQPGQLFRLCP